MKYISFPYSIYWHEFSMNERKSWEIIWVSLKFQALWSNIEVINQSFGIYNRIWSRFTRSRDIDIDTREAKRVRINEESSTFQVNSQKRAARCWRLILL